MKAERRHELQHNEVADWLAKAIERAKPYSRAIVGVALAATVLLITYVVLSNRSETRQTSAWNQYYKAINAPSPEGVQADLEAVAETHKKTVAGHWAQVALADLQLGEGINDFFRDKSAAKKKLASAIEHYGEVVSLAEDPLLVARARYGMARAQESLGKLDDARETYKQIVQAPGTNAYAAVAKLRLDDLNRTSTEEFYAWFAEQEPVPASSSSSLPGTPGERLPFDTSSFGSPGDLKLSGENILNIPGLEKSSTGPSLINNAQQDGKLEQKENTKDESATEKSATEKSDGEKDKGNATKETQPSDADKEKAPPEEKSKDNDSKADEATSKDSKAEEKSEK
jgi:hypothetical protein